ncbi:MAG TPA: LysO family transporter, partial [Salinivirgaceae bacterium]|nr:LysO family transporter [Salinivirgaceae bacterium]
MLGSLIILIFFVIGTLVGYYDILPFDLQNYDADKYTLYLLMFLVGIGIGSNKESLSIIKKINWKMVIIPLITIVGTFLGVTFSALFISGISIYDIWAIGAGYGYYSLSSIYISSIRGEALGAIALLSN